MSHVAPPWFGALTIPRSGRGGLGAIAESTLTSRDYIWEQALAELKRSGTEWLARKKLVVNVKELSLDEKRQITYNHIRLGNQPQTFRAQVKPHLELVASSPHFMPEIARRLGDRKFTQSLQPTAHGLTDFVSRPRDLLEEIVAELDGDLTAALLLLFVNGGHLAEPVPHTELNRHFLSALDSTLQRCELGLHAMRGSLVNLETSYSSLGPAWVYRHPTIAEAIAAVIRNSPRLVGVCLDLAPVDVLVSEFSTSSGLGRTIVIPASLHPRLAERLNGLLEAERNAVLKFLSERTSADFLRLFQSVNADVAELALSNQPELLVGLLQAGVLDVNIRQRCVELLVECALDNFNFIILRQPEFLLLMSPQEERQFRRQLGDCVKDGTLGEWIENSAEVADVEDTRDLVEELLRTLRSIDDFFKDDQDVTSVIDESAQLLLGILHEIDSEDYQEMLASYDPSQCYSYVQDDDESGGEARSIQFPRPLPRSIFDDIDADPDLLGIGVPA